MQPRAFGHSTGKQTTASTCHRCNGQAEHKDDTAWETQFADKAPASQPPRLCFKDRKRESPSSSCLSTSRQIPAAPRILQVGGHVRLLRMRPQRSQSSLGFSNLKHNSFLLPLTMQTDLEMGLNPIPGHRVGSAANGRATVTWNNSSRPQKFTPSSSELSCLTSSGQGRGDWQWAREGKARPSPSSSLSQAMQPVCKVCQKPS